MSEERQMKSEHLCSFSLESFDGPIDAVIHMLSEQRDQAIARGYNNLRIDASHYYEDIDINLYGERLETDEEYNFRIAQLLEIVRRAKERKKAAKKKSEEQERMLYEKLKKKFEG